MRLEKWQRFLRPATVDRDQQHRDAIIGQRRSGAAKRRKLGDTLSVPESTALGRSFLPPVSPSEPTSTNSTPHEPISRAFFPTCARIILDFLPLPGGRDHGPTWTRNMLLEEKDMLSCSFARGDRPGPPMTLNAVTIDAWSMSRAALSNQDTIHDNFISLCPSVWNHGHGQTCSQVHKVAGTWRHGWLNLDGNFDAGDATIGESDSPCTPPCVGAWGCGCAR